MPLKGAGSGNSVRLNGLPKDVLVELVSSKSKL